MLSTRNRLYRNRNRNRLALFDISIYFIAFRTLALESGLPKGIGERRFLRGEGGGGRRGSFSPSALSLFRFYLSPFLQKRLILRLAELVFHALHLSRAPSPLHSAGVEKGRKKSGSSCAVDSFYRHLLGIDRL